MLVIVVLILDINFNRSDIFFINLGLRKSWFIFWLGYLKVYVVDCCKSMILKVVGVFFVLWKI